MSSDSAKFYYAVAVGRNVGIYNTWNECKVQVENLQYAKYRKFADLDQAKSFINTWALNKGSKCEKTNSKQGSKSSPVRKENSRSTDEENVSDGTSGDVCIKKEKKKSKLYNCLPLLNRISECEKKFDICVDQVNSMLSGLNEIRKEFAEMRELCSSHISNKGTSSKEKSSKSSKRVEESNSPKGNSISVVSAAEEAQKMIEEGMFETNDFDLSEYTKSGVPTKRRRISSDNSMKESVSEDEWKESDSDEDFTLVTDSSKDSKGTPGKSGPSLKDLSFTVDSDGYVVVYTDGACKCNGQGQNSRAGIGIYFGEGNPLNLGRPLRGAPPSNSNAEIQAARIAMKIALQNNIKKLKIVTDSQYLLKSATEWLDTWKKNDWKRREKRPLKNKKELKKLDSVMSQLSVRWEKVLGHSGVLGNERADKLATEGASMYVKPRTGELND